MSYACASRIQSNPRVSNPPVSNTRVSTPRVPCVSHVPRVSRVSRHRPIERPRAGVIPQLESLILQHVCPIMNCEGLYIGDEHHQMHVLNTFMSISRTMDISHGVGYVLRALLAGEKDLAYDMAASFDTYNSSLELIHSCLERLDSVVDTEITTAMRDTTV